MTIKSHIYDYYVSKDFDGIITEEEKEEINNKIHALNIDMKLAEWEKTNFTSAEWINEIKEKFGIDVQAEYARISKNRESIKRKVQKGRLEKLKSDVTVGIREKEKMKHLLLMFANKK